MINTSKFYLKKNLVMESSEQIHEKEKMKEMNAEDLDVRIAELSRELSQLLQQKLG